MRKYIGIYLLTYSAVTLIRHEGVPTWIVVCILGTSAGLLSEAIDYYIRNARH